MNNLAFIGFDESMKICDTVEFKIMRHYHIKQECVEFGDYTVSFLLSNHNSYDGDRFEYSVKALLEDVRHTFSRKPYVITFHPFEKRTLQVDGETREDCCCYLTINKIKLR